MTKQQVRVATKNHPSFYHIVITIMRSQSWKASEQKFGRFANKLSAYLWTDRVQDQLSIYFYGQWTFNLKECLKVITNKYYFLLFQPSFSRKYPQKSRHFTAIGVSIYLSPFTSQELVFQMYPLHIHSRYHYFVNRFGFSFSLHLIIFPNKT